MSTPENGPLTPEPITLPKPLAQGSGTLSLPGAGSSPAEMPTLAGPEQTGGGRRPGSPVPGYEILDELGRGGMGVVYKARHIRLNRLVALKMILAGAHAGQDHLDRFRTEAEAIARLPHPNIVQIYEVGEADGQPFFALEFVEGGTLASHLASKPQPPGDAARLIECLARGVQAAHQAGVIHRDLKPGNILLTKPADQSHNQSVKVKSTDSLADRPKDSLIPKITDFGLAKKLDEDSSRTQSGAIVGTPSYMAPEQAGGKVKELGPACDIWALGAILYECLTGRPPFLGATHLDTLVQVAGQDPVPVRQLQPTTPRDLETICLKCLHKDPARRYSSAEALANDLRRYLDGEPIQARPVSVIERGYKWARRRPTAAALIAVSLLAICALAGVTIGFNVHLQKQRDYALEQRDQADVARDDADTQREKAEHQRTIAVEQKKQALANLKLAREAVDMYVKKMADDPRLQERGIEDVRRDWLKSAERFYQAFLAQSGNDPQLRADQALAYLQLAGVSKNLDAGKDAGVYLDRAEKAYQGLIRDFPKRQNEYRLKLATILKMRADVAKKKEDYATAVAFHKKARDIFAELVKKDPKNAEYRCHHAANSNNLGLTLKDARKFDDALAFFNEALAIIDGGPASTDEIDAESLRLMGWLNIAALHLGQERLDEAEKAYKRAVAVQSKIKMSSKRTSDQQKIVGFAYFSQGLLYSKMGRVAEAITAYNAAIKLFEPLARAHPHVSDYQNLLATSYLGQGMNYGELEQPAQAREWLLKADPIYQRLIRDYPEHRTYRTNRVTCLLKLAESAGSFKKSEEAIQELLAVLKALCEKYPQEDDYQKNRLMAHLMLAELYQDSDQRAKADEVFQRALTLAREQLKNARDKTKPRIRLGDTLALLAGHERPVAPARSLKLYAEAIALLTQALDEDPLNQQGAKTLRNALLGRSLLHQQQKQYQEMLKDRAGVIDYHEQLVCRFPEVHRWRRDLAINLQHQARQLEVAGKLADAETARLRGIDVLDDLVKNWPDDNMPVRSRFLLGDACGWLGDMYRIRFKGRENEAELYYRKALGYDVRVAFAEPMSATHLSRLSMRLLDLAMLLKQTKRLPEALGVYDLTEQAALKALGFLPGDRTATGALAKGYQDRSEIAWSLGKRDQAIEDAGKVVAYRESRVKQYPKAVSVWGDLAGACETLGRLLHQTGRLTRADQILLRGIEAGEQMMKLQPGNLSAAAGLARLHSRRAQIQDDDNDNDNALASREKERVHREALVKARPTDPEELDSLAGCLALLGRGYMTAKKHDKAVERQTAATVIRRDLYKRYPRTLYPKVTLAQDLSALGLIHHFKEANKDAAKAMEEAVPLWNKVIAEALAAKKPQYERSAATCFSTLGLVLLEENRTADAVPILRRAVALWQACVTRNDKDTDAALQLGGSACNLGNTLVSQNKRTESVPMYDLAIKHLTRLHSRFKQDRDIQTYLRNSHYGRALALRALNRHREALVSWDLVIDLETSSATLATLRMQRAVCLCRLDRHTEAVGEVRKLLALPKVSGSQFYNAACVLSLAGAAIRDQESVPLPLRETRARGLAAESMRCLEGAAKEGYFKDKTRRQHLDKDPDLGLVRGSEPFRQLMAGLK